MTPFGAFALKHTSTTIFVLWLAYIGTFGEILFGELYLLKCEEDVMPFAVWTLLLGCFCTINFAIFRVFAGHLHCGTRQPSLRTQQSQIAYYSHSAFALLSLVTTGLCFARIVEFSCKGYAPSAAPFVCVSLINFLNGFVSIEQSPCCGASSCLPRRRTDVERAVLQMMEVPIAQTGQHSE